LGLNGLEILLQVPLPIIFEPNHLSWCLLSFRIKGFLAVLAGAQFALPTVRIKRLLGARLISSSTVALS